MSERIICLFGDNRKFCLIILIPLLLVFNGGCGKKSPPTLKDYELLSPVQGLKAERVEDEILLSWEYPSSYRKRLKGFLLTKTHQGKEEHIALPPESSAFKEVQIKGSETYDYRIRAVNRKGIPSQYSEQLTIKVCPMPEPPKELSFKVHKDSIEIIWTAVDKNLGIANPCKEPLRYNVYKADTPDSFNRLPLNDSPIETNSYKAQAEPDRKIYYSIRPIIQQGIIQIGKASKPIVVSPSDFVPSRPLIIDSTINNKRAYLIWQEAPEVWVRGYRVYRKTADGNFVVVAEPLTAFFTEHIGAETKVYYRVTSVGPSSESLPAERMVTYDR